MNYLMDTFGLHARALYVAAFERHLRIVCENILYMLLHCKLKADYACTFHVEAFGICDLISPIII